MPMSNSEARKRRSGDPDEVTAYAPICSTNPHHFVWTWPIEGGRGSVGVCVLCGAVTTGEREADIRRRFEADLAAERANHEALREAVSGLLATSPQGCDGLGCGGWEDHHARLRAALLDAEAGDGDA